MKPQARCSSDGSVLNRAMNAAEVAANKASKASFADTATGSIEKFGVVPPHGILLPSCVPICVFYMRGNLTVVKKLGRSSSIVLHATSILL